MRVGYFVETPVEHNLTGGTRSFLNLIDELLPMGIQPFVVVHEEWALTEELRNRNIPFFVTKMYRPFIGIEDITSFPRVKYVVKTIINTASMVKATIWLKKNNVELIHINSQFTGIVGIQSARILGIPYVYHIREFLDVDFGVEFFNKKKAYRLIAEANAVIAISEDIKIEFEKRLKRKITLIYNGIPFEKAKFPEHTILSDKTVRMLMIGRINHSKNQLEAVKAVELLKNNGNSINLTLVGAVQEDSATLDIVKYIKEKNLADVVSVIPFTSNPYLYLNNNDIGLICSLREPFGRVTVEYMLGSLLVIGANTGGTTEIIKNGQSGILYSQGNPEDLASKIKWVIENKNKAIKIMQNGKERALKNFTIEKTASNVFLLYKTIVSR